MCSWRLSPTTHERKVALEKSECPNGNEHLSDSNARPSLRAIVDEWQSKKALWKWDHYFNIYERHLSRFRDREVHLLEIGVMGGGSLEMWREYLGKKAHIYGVDIDSACALHQGPDISIFIGNQSSRPFWRSFRSSVPSLDIVIDDGSHIPDHQLIALDELLPTLNAGGVYLCEDIHSEDSPFSNRILELAKQLQVGKNIIETSQTPERFLVSPTTPLQSWCEALTVHPFAIVLEKRSQPLREFVAAKRGSPWPPSSSSA